MDKQVHTVRKLEKLEKRIRETERALRCAEEFLQELGGSGDGAAEYVSAIRAFQEDILVSLIRRRENLLRIGEERTFEPGRDIFAESERQPSGELRHSV